MSIDIKKVVNTPKDDFEAISFMVKTEQHLLTAIHILQSVIDNHDEEYWEIHEKRIKQFLSQFEG